MESEYIDIEMSGWSETGKTAIFGIYSKRDGSQLGEVRWYPPWRQYAFYPAPETIWNKDCLNTIEEFLEDAKYQEMGIRALEESHAGE